MSDDGWDLIFSYTRKQAIEDGVLIEVPKDYSYLNLFRFQTIITNSVYKLLDKENIEKEYEKLFKTISKEIIQGKSKNNRLDFIFNGENMYALCHPDDDGVTPVITIMLIGED